MPEGLYERDTLLWSEQQADLLRRLAAGERVNEAVDWSHVIEEVHDVGLSELRSCISLLGRAMTHVLWLYAYPESSASQHWLDEARAFLVDAADRYTPSMRQRLDLPAIYSRSLAQARKARKDAAAPRPLPDHCPFTLEQLLSDDVDQLLERLR